MSGLPVYNRILSIIRGKVGIVVETGHGFDREKSLMLKGIAAVMMVFHHCFRKADFYRGYAMAFAPLKESQVINLAHESLQS